MASTPRVGSGVDGASSSKKQSLEDRIRRDDAWFKEELKSQVNKVPEKDFKGFSPAPMTFLDGLTAAKARELNRVNDKKNQKKKHSDVIDQIQKLKSHDEESLLNAANAAGISKDMLQYAVNSLPQLSKADEGDRRTVFWRIMDDYFRQVNKDDLHMLETLLRDPNKDSEFKVPLVGKKYRLQWQDEEKAQAHLDQVKMNMKPLTPSPIVKNKSRVSQPKASTSAAANAALERQKKLKVALTSTLSPKPESQDHSELCDVCFEGESVEGNEIVFCDSCNVAVHQVCYGISVVPKGPWLCNKCLEKKNTGREVSCVLCPVRNGALKPMNPKKCVTCTGEPSKKQEYVHLFCSQWIPETFIKAEDTARMEPVQNVNGIAKDRFKLLCSICKQRHGACIQCSHGMCATSFHPLCARATGLRMEVVGYEGSDDIDLKVYCQKHSKRPVKRALDARASLSSQSKAGSSSKEAKVAANSSTALAKEPSKKEERRDEIIIKPKAKGERTLDLLDDLQSGQCASLLRQICTIFGVKVADVARQVGMEPSKLSTFMSKKSPVKEKELEKIVEWIRRYSGSLLSKVEDTKKTEEKKKEESTVLSSKASAAASEKGEKSDAKRI